MGKSLYKKFRITKLALALAVSIMALAFLGIDDTKASSNTIKMSPVRTDLRLDPGEVSKVQVTATNLTDQPVLVRPVVNDFIAGDESGTPALILEDGQYAPTRSLKRFVGNLDSVLVPGRESRTIDVTISVPKDARPGGYFGAIRLSPANPDGGGQVNLSASVASLVLLRVNGEASESLIMTDFYVKDGGEIRDVFHSAEDANISVRFDNTGDVQLDPFGKIVVIRSGVVVYEVDFNNKDSRDMILPGSARVWSIPIENVDELGEYEVRAVFTYGQKNNTIEVSKSFFVIPYIWIFIGISILVALIIVIALLVAHRKRRRRNYKYKSISRGRRR